MTNTPPGPEPLSLPGLTLGRVLGEGSYGTVYLARQAGLERDVAVKVLTSGVSDAGIVRRFLREARTMADLSNNNFIRLFGTDFDHHPPYIVMEYMPAGTLRERIRTRAGVPLALELAPVLLNALGTLHDAGIIHRDVKPANVLFRSPGEPVLADLGLVRPVNADATRITGTGHLLGTLAYLPPEAFTSNAATPALDLFALGVTLYQCVTGEHPAGFRPIPLEFSPPDLAARVRGCPPELAQLIQALLQPDPAARPRSAAAALAILEGRGRRRPPAARPARRHRKRIVAPLAGVALALILVAGFLARRAPPRPEVSAGPSATATATAPASADALALAAQPLTVLGAVEGGERPALLVQGRPGTRAWLDGETVKREIGPEGGLLPIPDESAERGELDLLASRDGHSYRQWVRLPESFRGAAWRHVERFGLMVPPDALGPSGTVEGFADLFAVVRNAGLYWVGFPATGLPLPARIWPELARAGGSPVLVMNPSSTALATEWSAALAAGPVRPRHVIVDAQERTPGWRSELSARLPETHVWGPPMLLQKVARPAPGDGPPAQTLIADSMQFDESLLAISRRRPDRKREDDADRVEWLVIRSGMLSAADGDTFADYSHFADDGLRIVALARARFPRARTLCELPPVQRAEKLFGGRVWETFLPAARLLDKVEYVEMLSLTSQTVPRLENVPLPCTPLVFEGGGRRVYALVLGWSRSDRPACRFLPRRPGVLWETAGQDSRKWTRQLNSDARGMTVPGKRPTAIYEEVIPVEATPVSEADGPVK